MSATHIILKITGESFLNKETNKLDKDIISHIAEQIKQLPSIRFGIVVGGGNFFRGSKQGKDLDLTPSNAHYIGMLATVMNGLIIKNIFDSADLPSSLFCALNCPQVAENISQDKIDQAVQEGKIPIFTGGTGNPFFSTDTNAVLRALQFKAPIVWKGTKVDGVYDKDPAINLDAIKLNNVSFDYAIAHKLKIMDITALSLAQENAIKIRVFNIFEKNALLKAENHSDFGSLIL